MTGSQVSLIKTEDGWQVLLPGFPPLPERFTRPLQQVLGERCGRSTAGHTHPSGLNEARLFQGRTDKAGKQRMRIERP